MGEGGKPTPLEQWKGGRSAVVRANVKGSLRDLKTLRDGTREDLLVSRRNQAAARRARLARVHRRLCCRRGTEIRDRLAGTFNGLVRGYTLSVEFTEKLAASVAAEYKRMLTAAEAEFGKMPLAALDDPARA